MKREMTAQSHQTTEEVSWVCYRRKRLEGERVAFSHGNTGEWQLWHSPKKIIAVSFLIQLEKGMFQPIIHSQR